MSWLSLVTTRACQTCKDGEPGGLALLSLGASPPSPEGKATRLLSYLDACPGRALRSGPMDAHRDGADVDPRAPAQAQKRAPAAVAKDRIRCVARVAIRAAAVRLAPEDTIRERVRNVELARVDDVARDVHLDVDVHRAAAVPAWED